MPSTTKQALRALVRGLEAEAAAVVEEQGDWDRIWLGRPGLLEAVEELLESGKGADVEVRTMCQSCRHNPVSVGSECPLIMAPCSPVDESQLHPALEGSGSHEPIRLHSRITRLSTKVFRPHTRVLVSVCRIHMYIYNKAVLSIQ